MRCRQTSVFVSAIEPELSGIELSCSLAFNCETFERNKMSRVLKGISTVCHSTGTPVALVIWAGLTSPNKAGLIGALPCLLATMIRVSL